MRTAEVAPNARTYEGFLDACRQEKQGRRAVRLMQEYQRSGLPPCPGVYSAAVRACATSGDAWARALRYHEEAADLGLALSAEAEAAVLAGHAWRGGWETAAAALRAMHMERPEVGGHTYVTAGSHSLPMSLRQAWPALTGLIITVGLCLCHAAW
eukprot:5897396-Pyramimonas_sp.AAC.1